MVTSHVAENGPNGVNFLADVIPDGPVSSEHIIKLSHVELLIERERPQELLSQQLDDILRCFVLPDRGQVFTGAS